MRTTVAALAFVAALTLGVPAGLATTATSSSNGLTVTVSLSDDATATAPFTVSETIANTGTKTKLVWATQTLQGPSGVHKLSYPLFLGAGKSLSFSVTFPLPAVVPPGTYSLTLTANTASATATTTVT